ncbi:MAG: hypothetical protein RLZZ437_2076 [Pseudomonadota bacterium]
MRISSLAIVTVFSATSAMAGALVPMPGTGIAGPVALLAAVGAVVGIKYLRGRRTK